jgi:hypothetical protein
VNNERCQKINNDGSINGVKKFLEELDMVIGNECKCENPKVEEATCLEVNAMYTKGGGF